MFTERHSMLSTFVHTVCCQHSLPAFTATARRHNAFKPPFARHPSSAVLIHVFKSPLIYGTVKAILRNESAFNILALVSAVGNIRVLCNDCDRK